MTKKQKNILEELLDVMVTEGSKKLADRMVTSYLPEEVAPPPVREQLRAEAEREIYNALNTVRTRFTTFAQQGMNLMKPRKEVLAACKVLQVEPPKLGKPVDLDKANRNKRSQMKTYHPDISPNTRDEFEAAARAYDVLANYNAALGGANGT